MPFSAFVAILLLSLIAASFFLVRRKRTPPPTLVRSASGEDRDDFANTVSEVFGQRAIMGYRVDAPAPVSYVHVIPSDDHFLYLVELPDRRAFTLRVLGDAAERDPDAWKRAPLWPVRLLTEIAGVEQRLGRQFKNREDLTNIRFASEPQPPFRHVSFMSPDPHLKAVGKARTLRVLPLTDEQKESIYSSGKLGALAEWYDRDPLMRVADPGHH